MIPAYVPVTNKTACRMDLVSQQMQKEHKKVFLVKDFLMYFCTDVGKMRLGFISHENNSKADCCTQSVISGSILLMNLQVPVLFQTVDDHGTIPGCSPNFTIGQNIANSFILATDFTRWC